jgi:hypothetical protein
MGEYIRNTFDKGLNKDLSKGKTANNTLLENLGFNIVTELGLSTLALETPKGNKYSFTIPNTFEIYKITIRRLPTQALGYNLYINGQNVGITLSTATTIFELFQQMQAFNQVGFSIQLGLDFIYIIGTTQNPVITSTMFNGGPLTLALHIPAQTDLTIIGWKQIRDSIGILTTSKTNTTPYKDPDGNASQIWKLDFDDVTDEVISPNGTALNSVDHLYYNDRLNLSLQHEIYREIEGRYENTKTQRFYWTDNYNYPRAFNFALENSFTTPPGLLDWKADVNLSIPILDSIIPNSGNIPVGKVGYFYQLQSADGALTPYSDISNLIILTDSIYAESSQQYKGAAAGTNSTKSIKFYIDSIDQRYSIIKVCYVLYQNNNVPEFYKFNEFTISSDKMFFIHTGNEADTSLSLDEVINPNIQFDTCKSITYKYNRLYAANTTTKNFSLDFDGRFYRYSGKAPYNFTDEAPQVAKVWSQDGRYKLINTSFEIYNVNGNPITPEQIADTEDLVNAYNDESGTVFGLFPTGDVSVWDNIYQFKFQADGLTLGGSGKNVSYKFVYEDLACDYVATGGLTHTDGTNGSGPVYQPRGTDFVNIPTGDNTTSVSLGVPTQDYLQQGYANLKSSSRESIYLTLQRGETYRVGIRALNKKGETSFVNWMGDIRVPEAVEYNTIDPAANPFNFNLANNKFFGGLNYLQVRSIGVEFTIDTKDLPEDITAFQIVYVERTLDNRTRFGTGLHLPVLQMDTNTNELKVNGELTSSYVAGVYKGNTSAENWTEYPNQEDNQTGGGGGVSFIRSGFWPLQLGTNNQPNRIGIIKSPMADAQLPLTSASYIKLHEGAKVYESQYFAQNPGGGLLKCFGYWLKYNNSTVPTTQIRNSIDARQNVGIDSIVLQSVAPSVMQYDFHNVILRTGGSGGKIAGLGQTSEFVVTGQIANTVQYNTTFNLSNVTDIDALPFISFKDASVFTPGSTATDDNRGVPRCNYRLVQYCTFNIGQYGGPWRANRYNNEYIAFGNFIPIAVINPVIEVYKQFGDTWIGMYSSVYAAFPWIDDHGVASRGGVGSGLGNIYVESDNYKQISVVYPCEAPINGDMRFGQYWAADQVRQQNDIDDFASFQFDENLFNLSYDQKNNAKKFIPEPFNVNFDEEQPHRVWVSQNKLDSEVIDSWRIFRVNDYKDLEGTYGQINKIVNFKDRIIAYQDRAVGWVQSEENSALRTTDTLAAQIGTGDILTRYQYISIESGSIHQHSVVVAPDSVHSFDARLRKYMILQNTKEGTGLKPSSDVEGLSAFFRDNVFGEILQTDQVLLGVGIHGVYDTKFNRCFMTFLNIINDDKGKTTKKFTTVYNDLLQAFEKHEPFTPNLYLNTGKRLLSAKPITSDDVYVHSQGNFMEYYGSYYPASVTFICKFPDETNLLTARVDTLEFWSEVFNNAGVNLPLESVTSIKMENDYQSTFNSLNPLTDSTLKRRERTWRVSHIKDYTPPYNNVKIKPYLRDKYVKVTLTFNNPQHRLILHDINTQITKSYH